MSLDFYYPSFLEILTVFKKKNDLTKADLSVLGVWECSTQQHDGEVLRPATVYHSGLTPNGDRDQAESL